MRSACKRWSEFSSTTLALVVAATWGIADGRLPASSARADEPAPGFAKDVLPILEAKCNRCHGGKSRGGKLDLRTLDAVVKGGVTGPAVKPGDSKKSLLIELIHYDEMPPKKERPRVTKDELERLKKWVDAGAKP